MRFAYADRGDLVRQPGWELAMGAAGEHLVCADLLIRGVRAMRADQCCPYDVAAEVDGRLIRIQVKATMNAKPFPQKGQAHITGYTWCIRHGKSGLRSYVLGVVDMVALVALDCRRIAYVPFSRLRQTMQIPVSGALKSTRAFEDYSWDLALGGL